MLNCIAPTSCKLRPVLVFVEQLDVFAMHLLHIEIRDEPRVSICQTFFLVFLYYISLEYFDESRWSRVRAHLKAVQHLQVALPFRAEKLHDFMLIFCRRRWIGDHPVRRCKRRAFRHGRDADRRFVSHRRIDEDKVYLLSARKQ